MGRVLLGDSGIEQAESVLCARGGLGSFPAHGTCCRCPSVALCLTQDTFLGPMLPPPPRPAPLVVNPHAAPHITFGAPLFQMIDRE